jgi:hypothetical protein
MDARKGALIIGGLDIVVWSIVAVATFTSQSDPATQGLDTLAGILVSAFFLITAVPAVLLAWRGIWPRLALALALAFPGVFVVLFIGAVIAFS